jgi:ribosomal protein S18 acetylase RimI-like enzyme
MNIEFRKALIPGEIPELCEFDKKAFHAHPADTFSADEWKKYESCWMLVDQKIVGCLAMETDKKDELWISSTAVLPKFRGQKFGDKLKEWEIEYAKSHGYERIGTIMRESNKIIIHLNEKFGFKKDKLVPGAYSNPAEPGIVMRLRLPLPNCPKCGKQLRTHRAKQCACGADWH